VKFQAHRTSRAGCGKIKALFGALFLAWLAGGARLAAAAPPVNTTPGLPTLTRVEQIRRLTPEQANLGYPIRIRGVVTYYGGYQWELFVQDPSGGIYVEAESQQLNLRPGDLIEVEGFSTSGGYAPDILEPKIRVLGGAPMPKPRRVTLKELATGGEDSQWVEIEGIVRSAIDEEGRLALEVVGDGRFKARMPGFNPEARRLVGAKVLLRGTCGSLFNQKRQITGTVLYVPDLSYVEVTEPGPPDPFALPIRSLRSLMQFDPRGGAVRPGRLHGIVTLRRGAKSLFISDGSDGISVKTVQADPLEPGDEVDVVGFPSVGEYTPVLEDAIFRKVGRGTLPQPVQVTAEQARNGEFDAELVQVEGRLAGVEPLSNETVLILESGSDPLFDVHVPRNENGRGLPAPRIGSRLRLTGICSVEVDDNRAPRAFRLLLRSPSDIVVLEAPPRLTRQHLLFIVGLLAGAILLVLVWVRTLRHRVNRQTETIRGWLQKEVVLKKRYQELFENANDIVFTLDLNGRFTSLNRAGEQLSGYTRDEALTMTAAQVVAPEYVSVVQRELARAAGGESVTPFEIEHIAKGGRRVWLEVSLRPVREGEQVVGLQAIARDFTERRLAEEAVRKSNEMLQAIFTSSPVPILMVDKEGKILLWNPAAVRTFGWSEAEVLGRPNPTVPADQAEEFRRFREQVLSGQGFKGIEVRRQKKDGTLVDISLSTAPICDAQGNARAIVALLEDITERKRAHEELRKLSQAVEQSPASVMITDPAGAIEYVNPKFSEITGYAPAEVQGKNPRLLKSGLTPQDVYAQLWKTITAGGEWRGELLNKKKNGELYWEAASISPVRNDRGKITHYLAVKEDITERKRAEAELRKAKDAAEAATRAKSTFLATMSHEIRTPINGIIGMTELALDTPLTAEQREYLTTVKESSAHLLHLINDVLNFSKIEAGKLEMDQSEFNLRPTLESVLRPLAAQARQKGLPLELEIGPGVPGELTGDPVRLGQVVVNLVGNAIKFTEHGSVKLRVATVEVERQHVALRFSVSDTGIGIPAEKHRVIFDSFTQADGSTTRKYGGTGLGLAISRRLVELMGGRIWVESEAGKGTTFHFTACFGLNQPPNVELAGEAPVQDAGSTPERLELGDERGQTQEDRGPLRILLAEDIRVNELVVVRALEKQGHKVVVAGNGLEALAALDREPFDLVLMDVQMPEMDGIEATIAIREREKTGGGHIPIIAMTAHALESDKQRCLTAGMDVYLSKPVGIQELKATIESVVFAFPRRGVRDAAPGRKSEQPEARADTKPEGDDRELLAELAGIFLDECPKRMETIREAVARGDAGALEAAAHALKGSLGNFTDNGPMGAARRLEAMGRDKNLKEAEDALANLEEEMLPFNRTLLDIKKGVSQ
jgi:PAS domain S-box-containing protein